LDTLEVVGISGISCNSLKTLNTEYRTRNRRITKWLTSTFDILRFKKNQQNR